MKHVSATEIKNNLGTYLDEAQQEPISITKNGKEFAVLVSTADYQALRKSTDLTSEIVKLHEESIKTYRDVYTELAK